MEIIVTESWHYGILRCGEREHAIPYPVPNSEHVEQEKKRKNLENPYLLVYWRCPEHGTGCDGTFGIGYQDSGCAIFRMEYEDCTNIDGS